MKILIVEDEFNAREGLAILIEKISPEYEICGKAADGEEGYEMAISLKPDLIFADIELPKYNGLQMIEKILDLDNKLPYKPLFVILSGYAEFRYAQQAIRYGVEEYLLKPITYEKLKSVLQKLAKLNDVKKVNGSRKTIGQNEILSSILLNVQNDSNEALEIIKEAVEPENTYVVNIYHGNITDTMGVINIVKSFCEYYNFKNYYISILKEYKIITLFINSEYEFANMIKKINYNLICSFRKLGFNDITIVLLPTKSLDDLSDALQKIIQLNSWALTLGNDMVIYPELTENIKCEDDKRIRKFDVKALSALKSENIDELLKINSEFLSYLKDNRYNPDQIKKSCTSYAFSILVYYKEFNVELYEKVQVERLLDRLNDSCTIKELNDCLDNLVIMYIAESQINQKVNSALVRKIINHISNYYFDKISLEDIAVKMNVSPEYLSHLFTKEVGASFSEYLKKFRINEAKKLMPNSNYKIYEIGEKIGYKDPKYFCKVFKEVTGFSPKEYMTKQ